MREIQTASQARMMRESYYYAFSCTTLICMSYGFAIQASYSHGPFTIVAFNGMTHHNGWSKAHGKRCLRGFLKRLVFIHLHNQHKS